MKPWIKKLAAWLLRKGIEEAEKKLAPKKPPKTKRR